MSYSKLGGIILVSFFLFQSCKKEVEINAATSVNESTALTEFPMDTLTKAPTEIKISDSSSANQLFSAVKNKEVDLNKDAITLTSVKEGSMEKAFLIFNDDQSKVEVFLPNKKKGIMFDRKGSEGNYTWTDGKYELITWKGYILQTLKQGTKLFAGDVKI